MLRSLVIFAAVIFYLVLTVLGGAYALSVLLKMWIGD
jgi:hypothetical protein